MRLLLAIALLITSMLPLAPLQAQEQVVAGISEDQISITTDFDGSELLIFGAVKRESAILQDAPLDVIVTLSGPSGPLNVRKKSKKFGIWINTGNARMDAAPSFYAVNTTAPLDKILSVKANQIARIKVNNAILAIGAFGRVANPGQYRDALIRIREKDELYQLNEGSVQFSEQTLFQTRVTLPANLTEGDFETRIFLLRGGEIVASYQDMLDVRKVGLGRWLYNLSKSNSPAYGVLALIIAVIAGWMASAVFGYFRR
jgi:uncharacterized protein (TIGR02186 family)